MYRSTTVQLTQVNIIYRYDLQGSILCWKWKYYLYFCSKPSIKNVEFVLLLI